MKKGKKVGVSRQTGKQMLTDMFLRSLIEEDISMCINCNGSGTLYLVWEDTFKPAGRRECEFCKGAGFTVKKKEERDMKKVTGHKHSFLGEGAQSKEDKLNNIRRGRLGCSWTGRGPVYTEKEKKELGL